MGYQYDGWKNDRKIQTGGVEKKNMKIWILNHYATNMFFEGGGRHQWFAKYLIRKGYDVKIFCANTLHNTDKVVDISRGLFTEKEGQDQVPYVFVKARPYQGNGKTRILNMMDYARNVKKVMKFFAEHEGNPDIILASSVHPLTLVSGIKMAKKFHIPCICEVRDLWPESLVEYGIIKKKSFVARILYRAEKHIYKKASAIIFSFPGGRDYIKDKKWEQDISLAKVYHISNGVDLEMFVHNQEHFQFADKDLDDVRTFKVLYTGSIRAVNNVGQIIEIAEMISVDGKSHIKFIIYGDGDLKEQLEEECKKKHLNNVIFKGHIDKKYIPYILSKSDLNIISGIEGNLGKYGVSWNKLYEYMASGKPIGANYNLGSFNVIEENGVGICNKYQNLREYAEDIERLSLVPQEEYEKICENAEDSVRRYDFRKLTDDLEKVLQQTLERNI